VTLRARLLLAGAPLFVALLFVGGLAMHSIGELGRSSQSILAQNYRSVLAAQRIKETLERIDDDAYFAATGHRDRSGADVSGARGSFEEELRVAEGNITEPGEAELVRDLRGSWSAYQERLDHCLTLSAGAAALDCYFLELRPRFDLLKDRADRVLTLNQDAMVLKGERARRDAERISAIMVGAIAIAVALGLALSSVLARRAVRPLAALGQSVEQFGRGDFAVRAPVRGGAEIAGLAAIFNAMAERIAEYRRSSLGEMLQAQLAAQSALDSLSDPVFIFATSGAIVSLNRAAEELFPGRQGEALDVQLLDPALRNAIDAVRFHVSMGKGAFAPRSFDEAVSVARPDGERVYLPRGAPVYEEGGGVIAATVVLQDVTRLRRFEELRDDLVSAAAHQFRTPLTSLRMAIHLCLEQVAGPLTEKQQDLLYAAREECERLQGIVDELLDLARLQSGKVDLAREEIGVELLVDRAVHSMRSMASSSGVELAGEPLIEGAVVSVDPQRIDLVFTNLIENALRHTPSGGRVVVRAVEAGDDVRFEVVDSGPGIPESERSRIFEKFYRGPGSSGGGAGIGLSIASDVVRAHGGAIGVDSEPGKGSTFWFTLSRVAQSS